MKKLIATTFSVCLALGSAGAFAQANTMKDSTKSTDGQAKDAMNKGAIERKDSQNRMQAPPATSTTPSDPSKASKNTTDGMAKESMNKGALERKDSQNRMDAGQGKPTASQDKSGAMQSDPMKKDKDGMKK